MPPDNEITRQQAKAAVDLLESRLSRIEERIGQLELAVMVHTTMAHKD